MSTTRDIRRATLGDARDLARLRRESLIELGMLAGSRAMAFERVARREIEDLLARNVLEAWLLFAGGRVVGSACVIYWQRLPYPDASLHAELAGVYVAPSHRQRGLAGALCREAVRAAKARAVRSIMVHPSILGRHLYSKLGFVEKDTMRLVASP